MVPCKTPDVENVPKVSGPEDGHPQRKVTSEKNPKFAMKRSLNKHRERSEKVDTRALERTQKNAPRRAQTEFLLQVLRVLFRHNDRSKGLLLC